jgi:AraC-like DNA-binding protein
MEQALRPGEQAARAAVVERAEAYVRAHADSRVRISRLCQAVGVSERALRNAFYDVRGTGPKRSMLKVRLGWARAALSEPHDRPITVSHVATRYGFFELGRFAGAYQRAFGEAPSRTIRACQSRRQSQVNDRSAS